MRGLNSCHYFFSGVLVSLNVSAQLVYDQLAWYGKGSMENYIDKNYGFDAGIYSKPIVGFMENTFSGKTGEVSSKIKRIKFK